MQKNIETHLYDDWVYDIETYRNQFYFLAYQDGMTDIQSFEVSPRKDERAELYAFLNKPNIRLIGYNNLGFDYPVIHYILTDEYLFTCSAKDWVHSVKKRANKIIESMRSDDRLVKFKYSIWEKDIIIPQIDLFKLHHFDRKFVSLKALEFAMRFENVQDLPYAHNKILTVEEMEVVAQYCHNDVQATYKFFKLSEKHITIRQAYISDGYSPSLLSANEIGISKEVFTKLLATEMGMKQSEVKKLRTRRSKVDVKDLIFDYMTFNDPINRDTLNKFSHHTWVDTSKMKESEKKKHSLKFSVPYKNVVREYAEGGLHSCCEPGSYESDDDYILVDLDFNKAESN